MMISFSAFIFVNDMDSGLKFGTMKHHAKLEIKNVVGTYLVFLKKFVDKSKSMYLLRDLDSVKFNKEEIVLKFVKPYHDVLVIPDDDDQMKSFLKDLRSVSEKLKIKIGKSFFVEGPGSMKHIYDYNRMQKFDVTHLRVVALEDCNIPYLPEGLGNLALSNLSLKFSRINMSQNSQDLFWDWMTKHNISTSLTVLDMHDIGLKKLPFEIIHLKRLQSLDVSYNELTLAPHFIGELPKLTHLKIHYNLLSYLPYNLVDKVSKTSMKTSDIHFPRLPVYTFYDLLSENVELARIRDVPKLWDLSVLSLIKNDVKFKRREIPRSMWNSYDFVCRCKTCKKLFVFDEKYQKFHYSYPTICQRDERKINWQYFKCSNCMYM